MNGAMLDDACYIGRKHPVHAAPPRVAALRPVVDAQ